MLQMSYQHQTLSFVAEFAKALCRRHQPCQICPSKIPTAVDWLLQLVSFCPPCRGEMAGKKNFPTRAELFPLSGKGTSGDGGVSIEFFLQKMYQEVHRIPSLCREMLNESPPPAPCRHAIGRRPSTGCWGPSPGFSGPDRGQSRGALRGAFVAASPIQILRARREPWVTFR